MDRNLRIQSLLMLFLSILLLSISSCSSKGELTGVIIDYNTKRPIRGVKASAIVDIKNNNLITAEAISANDGRFQIKFERYQTLPDSMAVNLTKDGFRSNLYKVKIGMSYDTLVMVREQALKYYK